jgi:hypothetical protein
LPLFFIEDSQEGQPEEGTPPYVIIRTLATPLLHVKADADAINNNVTILTFSPPLLLLLKILLVAAADILLRCHYAIR